MQYKEKKKTRQRGDVQMVDGVVLSYKKLWKLLIDKDINGIQLRKQTGVTAATMAKMKKDYPVHLEALLKICKVLECGLDDIVEVSHKDYKKRTEEEVQFFIKHNKEVKELALQEAKTRLLERIKELISVDDFDIEECEFDGVDILDAINKTFSN